VTDSDQSRDRPGDQMARLTVAEAAKVLGITESGVRKRVQRSQIPHERDDGGRVWVWVSPGETRQAESRDEPDQSRDEPDQSASTFVQMLSRIEDLREQLAAERRANEENRRIIAALTSRIPELEAPRETASEKPSEAPAVAADEQQGRGPLTHDEGASTEPTEALGGPGSGTARGSWWRRMFGG
jgi:excisionase family DNA binding protein